MNLINDISESFNWVSLILTLILFKQLSIPYRYFSVYIVALPFLVLIIDYTASLHQNNLYLKHMLAHFEMLAYSFFFYQIFNAINLKKTVVITLLAYITCSIILVLTVEPLNVYPSYISFIYYFVLIAYSLIFFVQTFIESEIESLVKYSLFWIVTGSLLYYASLLLSVLFTNSLVSSSEIKKYIYYVYFFSSLMSVVFNLFFAVALLLDAFQKKKITNLK